MLIAARENPASKVLFFPPVDHESWSIRDAFIGSFNERFVLLLWRWRWPAIDWYYIAEETLNDNFYSNNISLILRFKKNKIKEGGNLLLLSFSNFFIPKWNVKFFMELHLILSWWYCYSWDYSSIITRDKKRNLKKKKSRLDIFFKLFHSTLREREREIFV